MAVVGVPGALFFSHLSDKFRNSKVKVILGLEIVAAAMLAFTVLSPNTTMLMVSLTLYGLLGKMAVDPILISFVSEQASAKSLGRAFSLFNFFGMSSAVVAPTLTGFISDVTGSKEISFVISACLVVTGTLMPGIIVTAVMTGLVNISNTYGAIRGTDIFYLHQGSGSSRYRRSFMISGLMTLVTVPFAVVPFSPFVSSIGLLTQTGDSSRKSFICGSALCLLVAIITPLTRLFCAIPLAISSAVMLVSYLPLLYSGLVFSQQITFTARNIYRLALPLFVGIFLMGLPPVYLQDLPLMIRPLLSNGLLVGILLAVLMENLIPWERIK